jgi:hypothetical protein
MEEEEKGSRNNRRNRSRRRETLGDIAIEALPDPTYICWPMYLQVRWVPVPVHDKVANE